MSTAIVVGLCVVVVAGGLWWLVTTIAAQGVEGEEDEPESSGARDAEIPSAPPTALPFATLERLPAAGTAGDEYVEQGKRPSMMPTASDQAEEGEPDARGSAGDVLTISGHRCYCGRPAQYRYRSGEFVCDVHYNTAADMFDGLATPSVGTRRPPGAVERPDDAVPDTGDVVTYLTMNEAQRAAEEVFGWEAHEEYVPGWDRWVVRLVRRKRYLTRRSERRDDTKDEG